MGQISLGTNRKIPKGFSRSFLHRYKEPCMTTSVTQGSCIYLKYQPTKNAFALSL